MERATALDQQPLGRAAWAGVALGALAALAIAQNAGVKGVGAVDEVLRAGAATVLVFGLCGLAITRLLTPPSLAAYRPLLVLPVGAAANGLAMTLLGFATVPFKVSLALVLAAGAASAVATTSFRVTQGTVPSVTPDALRGQAGYAFAAAALIAALALTPTFRGGIATVTGFGSDAHQVAGSVTFIQHNYPSSRDIAYPIDEVRDIWKSKYPIFYPLAAVSSVAGLESWEAMMTLAAVLLALTAVGFFILARRLLGASVGIAALGAALAVLDRQVFHIGLHPYYNQLWGLLTLPFSIVLAHAWVQDRSGRTLALLALVTAVGAFAYPLMLPFPLVALAGFWLLSGNGWPDPRGLWRGWKSLVWMIPAGLVLLVPIRGVWEKGRDAIGILVGGDSLRHWAGDMVVYQPFPEFLGMPDAHVVGTLGAVLVIALAAAGLLTAPRLAGVPLLVLLGSALAFALYFTEREHGQYFHFKILSFSGPLFMVAAVTALGRLRTSGTTGLALAAVGLVALSATGLAGARSEIGESFDQLQPTTIELREWSKQLPKDATIRLDTRDQLWRAYMLSDRRLGAFSPIRNFPHVSFTYVADYGLTEAGGKRPVDAVGEPVLQNDDLKLWRLSGRLPGRRRFKDTTSRRLHPIAADLAVAG